MPDKEKEKTQNVKFLENYQVQDSEAAAFEKDKVYELPEDSAKHFINRKVAVAVDVPETKPPKPIRDETPKESPKDKEAAKEAAKESAKAFDTKETKPAGGK